MIDEVEIKNLMGKISLGETKENFIKINKVFEKIDLDSSGQIDFKEFIAAFIQLETKENLFFLKEAFQAITDGEKTIDKKNLIKLLGYGGSNKRIDRLIEKYDINGDGMIDFDEFLEIIK